MEQKSKLQEFVEWLNETLDNTRMAPMPRAELYKKISIKYAEMQGEN